MKLLISGIVWGLLVVLLGVNILLNSIFDIDLPIFSIVIGFFIVFLGINIISSGSFYRGKSNKAIFSSKTFDSKKLYKQYETIFASSKIDLSNLKNTQIKKMLVKTLFAETLIMIPKDISFDIKTSTTFGETIILGEKVGVFGNSNKEIGSDSDKVSLKVETVFGQTNIIYKS